MKKLSILFLMSGFLTSNITQSRPLISGKTYRASNSVFEAGAPIRASIFNSESVAQHSRNGNKGAFQFVAYGGKTTKGDEAAAYFMPYGHTKYTVQGQQEFTKLPVVYDIPTLTPAFGTANGNLATYVLNKKTPAYDANTDTSRILPWNFGVDFAATYDQYANVGAGVGYSPQFKSTIAPEFHCTHAGVGAAFKYHFSSEPQSFWVEAATAVEWKKNELKLNEKVVTLKLDLSTIARPTSISNKGTLTNGTAPAYTYAANNVTTESTMQEEVSLVWLFTKTSAANTAVTGTTGTYWPVSSSVTNMTADIKNITQAFTGTTAGLADNKVWKYGKLAAGGNKKTALADIELKFGYNFVSNPNYSSNGYVGVVIPTGNKANAEFLDQAVVGNNKHFGLMMGGATAIELSNSGNWTTSYRIDMNSRYLMRNIQKRSFDLYNNQGSRYLMVWEKTKWESAEAIFDDGDANTQFQEARNYSAGINFFTKDMNVTPGFQARINQALVMQSDKCFVELGWNISAREAEKVSLTKSWSETIAFPEATYSPLRDGLRLAANNKSYKNDALSVSIFDLSSAANTWNSAFEITEKQIDLNSAATPQSVSHTPYASLHYTWGDANSSRPGSIGVGGSYEFAQNNAKMNEWNVWGALSFNF